MQDAQLISQAGQVESLASDGLVSVSTGAGQPQKNMELAKFADSLGSSVPLQQNAEQVGITGLYARTSDGKMVELTKESVAQVMADITVGIVKKGGFGGDLDTLTEEGMYRVRDSITNNPEGVYYDAPIFVFKSLSLITQVIVIPASGGMVMRTKTSSGWSSWTRIDNFGYNTLAELSSGVAGFTSNIGNKLNGTKITDLDTLRTAGIYTFSSASDITVGLPPISDKSLMMLVTVTSYTGTANTLEYMQTAICGGVTYCREFYGNNWKGWKNLSNFGYKTLDELAAALKPKLGLS